MATTYEYKYDIKTIYDTFKKNRINVVSYLGTSNNNEQQEYKLSAYLSYVNNSTDTYIYARKSSPTVNSDEYKNYAYLKVGNTTYNFYHGHAYTYTENVSGQNTKPILIAYDFVNQISTDIKFKNVSISHNATAINNVPQTVNVFSPISYIIENNGKSTESKNEYSISKVEINDLLGGSTFADFTTYITYSYLDPTKYDGKVYENGKDTLSADPINDIHIWSMSPGHDEIGFAYKDINVSANGNKKINAYAYIHCGDVVLNKLYGSDDKYKANNEILEFKYVPSAVGRPVPTGTCLGTFATSGKINSEAGFAYICESNNDEYGQRLYDFVKCAYSYNLGIYNDKSFNEIYTHPSYRNNTKQCEFYEFIQGKNYNYTSGEEQVGIDEIDIKNVNTTYFITNVSDLPIHMIPNNLRFKLSVKCGHINGGTIDGEGDIILNNIYVSFNTENNSQDLMSIFDGSISFEVITDGNNNIYAHAISADESEYLKIIDNGIHEVTANEIGSHSGQIEEIEAYVIYEFKTDKIYEDFESGYPNKTIRGLYIEGTNDVVIRPSNTSVEQYISMDSSDFILEGNTNYTGDYRGKITKTNNTEQISSNTIYLNFILPNN